ncbi:unnamed protein product [Rhizoctonia solani]|uniref:Uncharacterized protein n=1 Tax=Rhizoctonia solani TaxID=456999 RepID=A0A8H3I0F0_9AGAM|nr:unnamed protein product [Rhizoctonia solani]
MNGTDLFTSPPKQPPKVQVGHPPLPPFKDVQEERILEIYGPPTSFQEDQLRDALEALCDRLNGRDAGYFFDSSGVRTFIVLENSEAVDEAIANREKLIIDPIQPTAQHALSAMVFSKATESFELREFVNFAISGAGLGATLSPLHSPRPFGAAMHAPLSFSALPPPALPLSFSDSRIGSPSISALGLVNPRTPSPPRKNKTALELGLETLAQQWGSPSPEATRVFRNIGSPRNTPLGARLFSPLHNYNASDDELTRGRARSRHISNDINSDPTLPAAKKAKRHASTDVSRVVAADVLNDLLERMRCELWVGVPRTTLASVVSSVCETLVHEEVQGWIPPDTSKRRAYDDRVRENAEGLVDWNACWLNSGDFSQLRDKLARR